MKAMRDAFGEALVELAGKDDRVVALTADLTEAIRLEAFRDAFPDRFYQMGIHESDMMGTAAGLAAGGFLPFATTFATFATSLAHMTLRVTVAYNDLPVVVTSSHGGLRVGGDGATHQSLEDIALVRVLPGFTVLVPADAPEAYAAVSAAARLEKPVYLRLGRVPTPIVTERGRPFVVGKATVMREGKDVGLVSTGAMTPLAMEAAEILQNQGIAARVVHFGTVKPLDEEALEKTARLCGALVAVEEHSIIGGFGGGVCEYLAESRPVPVFRVGTRDVFGESGEPDEIMERYGLSADAIASAARRVMKNK